MEPERRFVGVISFLRSDSLQTAASGVSNLDRMQGGRLRFLTYLAPCALPLYEHLAAEVGHGLGVRVSLATGTDPQALVRGEAEVAFLCSRPYVQLRDGGADVEPLAAPVLSGPRYQGRPVYFSDVIVPAGSRAERFEDLRGGSWAYNHPDSHSGYGITLHQLGRTPGPRPFFRRVVDAGFHQAAIRLVAAGAVDGSAIDSQVLAIDLRDDPRLASAIRVIESWGPSPIQPAVAAPHVPTDLRKAIREALIATAGGPAFEQTLVDRMVGVGDADYDPVREMMASEETGGLRRPD